MTEPTDPTAPTDEVRDPTTTDQPDAADGDTSDGSRSRSRRRRGGRGRGRGRRAGEDAAPTSTAEEPAADASADAEQGAGGGGGAPAGDDEASSGRRRRRGRRGRGRGRAGDGDSAAEASRDTDASSDATSGVEAPERGSSGDTPENAEKPEKAEKAASGDGSRKGGSAKGDASNGDSDQSGSGKGGSSKGGSSKGGSAKGGSGKSGSGKGGTAKGDAGRSADKDGGAATVEDPEDRDVAAAMAKGGTRMAAKRGRGGGSGSNGGRGRSSQRQGGVPEEVRRAILEGPPRTMLVTNREDRTQIGVLEDRTVCEHYVTRKKDVTFVGNIYMARVQNVLPGMEAAFLDIGKGRNGVLYAGEVLYDELDLEEGADERIENALKPGQKVLVQVTKDPMGSKGPRLTMHLSLAGRYVVLAPDSDLFGISRKLTDKERDRLRRIVKKVKPDHHGVIVRTAAENATEEQLTADVERLLAKWEKVAKAAEGAKALTSVYEEPALVVKVIRDNFGPEFERCIVDDEDLYGQVRGYLDEVAPELSEKVELYGQPTADARARAAGAPSVPEGADDTATDDGEPVIRDADGEAREEAEPEVPATVDLEAAAKRRETLPPLFDAYDVTDQLRKATGKKVWLPSGGYLIIEQTEAMKVIDVNTGKFTGGKDTNLEEVVLKTNLEAADEIVRQLRLRDIGGIIVIDFIDMLLKANQDQVVRRLKRELLRDRTKTRVSEVSRLGLVQMTRKNVSQGLVEAFSHTCETCEGRGLISELE